MKTDVYRLLAKALDRLPNRFPSTESGVELAVLRKIFSEEEATIACTLAIESEAVDDIAARLGRPAGELRGKLRAMRRKGLVWGDVQDGEVRYRLAPFVVGIYEDQLENMDHELAHLVEDYFEEGGLAGIMRPQPAIHRVMPAHGTVKTEWIMPYDDVHALLDEAVSFRLRDCICRKQQALAGHECRFPLRTCLSFSRVETPPTPNMITRKEALALLDMTEEVGLVHTVSNVRQGVFYICNCCGCCCGILRGITEFGIEESVAHANYYAVIDEERCLGCGTCADRCQVGAVAVEGLISHVNVDHCIGCGLCVSGCPEEAVHLQLKPEEQVVHPPMDYSEWEAARLEER